MSCTQTIPALPAVMHVRIQRGDSWSLVVSASTAEADIDLTGYTVEAKIHPAGGGDAVELSVTVDDPEAGQFTISLAADASAGLPSGWHSWCLVVTSGDIPPARRTWIKGNFVVEVCQ